MATKENLSQIDALQTEVEVFRHRVLMIFATSVLLSLPELKKIDHNPIITAKNASRKAAEEEAIREGKIVDISQIYKNLSSILKFDVEEPDVEKSPEKCQITASFLNRGMKKTIDDISLKKIYRTEELSVEELAIRENLNNARTLDGKKYILGFVTEAIRKHFLSSYVDIGTTSSQKSAKQARLTDDFDLDEQAKIKKELTLKESENIIDQNMMILALKLLADNKSLAEVMGKTGLSFIQVSKLRKFNLKS